MKNNRGISRRKFISKTAVAAAGIGLSAGTVNAGGTDERQNEDYCMLPREPLILTLSVQNIDGSGYISLFFIKKHQD